MTGWLRSGEQGGDIRSDDSETKGILPKHKKIFERAAIAPRGLEV